MTTHPARALSSAVQLGYNSDYARAGPRKRQGFTRLNAAGWELGRRRRARRGQRETRLCGSTQLMHGGASPIRRCPCLHVIHTQIYVCNPSCHEHQLMKEGVDETTNMGNIGCQRFRAAWIGQGMSHPGPKPLQPVRPAPKRGRRRSRLLRP